jgi:hypothetical protein
LPAAEYASPLAGRVYDLRHACVSTCLNSGIAPAQVAEWAGHSVAILLKIYAKCIDGQDDIAKRRIEEALGDPGGYSPTEPDAPDGDDGQARGTWARIGRRQPQRTGYRRKQPEKRERHPTGPYRGGVAFFVLVIESPLTESNR